jgi:hypothetical protein
MAEPITWRTVNGPSLAEAARPMEMAGVSINSGFDKLQNILQQREQMEIANANAKRNSNTQTFLDQLYAQYKTPEALAAAQAAGDVDRLQANFNGLIDKAAVRGAADSRLATLRDQTLKGQEFGDKQQQLKDRPIVNGILTRLYKGDGEGATKELDANPHLINQPDVQKQVADYMHVLKQRGREDTRFKWDEQTQTYVMGQREEEIRLRPLKEQGIRAGILASQTGAASSAYQLKRLKESDADALAAQDLAEQLRGNIFDKGELTPKAFTGLNDLMIKQGIGGTGDDAVSKRANLLQSLEKAMREGVEINFIDAKGKKVSEKVNNLPLSVVEQALTSSKDNWYNIANTGWAGAFEENLKNALARTRTANVTKDGRNYEDQVDSVVSGDYQNYERIMKEQAKLKQQLKASRKN